MVEQGLSSFSRFHAGFGRRIRAINNAHSRRLVLYGTAYSYTSFPFSHTSEADCEALGSGMSRWHVINKARVRLGWKPEVRQTGPLVPVNKLCMA